MPGDLVFNAGTFTEKRRGVIFYGGKVARSCTCARQSQQPHQNHNTQISKIPTTTTTPPPQPSQKHQPPSHITILTNHTPHAYARSLARDLANESLPIRDIGDNLCVSLKPGAAQGCATISLLSSPPRQCPVLDQ